VPTSSLDHLPRLNPIGLCASRLVEDMPGVSASQWRSALPVPSPALLWKKTMEVGRRKRPK